MKAVRIHAYGDRSVLSFEDAPIPDISPDDVRVRVIASSVNPVDWKIREGHLRKMLPHSMPLIPGWDFSGIIEAVGAQVKGFKVGEDVFCRPDIARNGTYAEFIAVKASEIARKPRTISHVEAATLPLAGITAWDCLITAGDLKSGQRVLIHAGSGGVGSLAVQIAKWRGAHVITTTSGPNAELVRSLGADEVIDYRQDDFTQRVKDVDLVVDTLGGAVQEASWTVLRPGGRLVSTISPPSAERAKALGVHGDFLFIQPNPIVLDRLSMLVESGKLRPVIGAEFALRDIADAHALSESGRAIGKIALYVAQP